MRAVEASAKTRKEAIQSALDKLGAELHETEIEILDEGSRGFLGLGARPVKVKVTLAHPDPDKIRPREHEERAQRHERRPQTERAERPARTERNDRGPKPERAARPESSSKPERAGRPESSSRPERPQQGSRRERGDRRRGRRDSAVASAEKTPAKVEQHGKSEQRGRGDRDKQDRGPRGERRPNPNRENATARPDSGRPARPERGERPQRSERPRRTEPAIREPRPAPRERVAPLDPEMAETIGKSAAALLNEVIEKMGMESQVKHRVDAEGEIVLSVASPDSAILIGRKGRNLSAMQFLINRMMLNRDDADTVDRIVVDVEGYLDRRKENLEDMARSLAKKAKESGRSVRVKPLNPQERRIIHLTLEGDEDVKTFSLGSSLHRRVVIAPKNADVSEERDDDGDRDSAPAARDRNPRPRPETRGAGKEAGRPRAPYLVRPPKPAPSETQENIGVENDQP